MPTANAPVEPARSSRLRRLIVPIAITGGAAYVLFQLLDTGKLLSAVRNATPAWVFAAFAAHLSSQIIGAARIRSLAVSPNTKNANIFRLAGVEAVSSGASYLLPLGLGDLARISVWRSWAKVGLVDMTLAIVVLRTIDIALVGNAVGAMWLLGLLPEDPWMRGLALGCALLGLIFAALLLGIACFGRRFYTRVLAMTAGLLDRLRSGLGRRLERWASEETKGEITFTSPVKQAFVLLGLTSLFWTANFGLYAGVARALRPEIGVPEAGPIFAASFALALAPVRGIADVGSHELGWSLPLTLAGLPRDDAVAVAAASHLLFASIVVLLAPMGAGALLFATRRSSV